MSLPPLICAEAGLKGLLIKIKNSCREKIKKITFHLNVIGKLPFWKLKTCCHLAKEK